MGVWLVTAGRYLKACRIVSREAVVVKNPADVKDEETKKLVQQGGCLVIKLDSLMDNASGRDYIQAEEVASIKSVLAAVVGKPTIVRTMPLHARGSMAARGGDTRSCVEAR